MEVAELGTVSEYLASGPGFVFLFHPALGPLWDVIAQKIRGGVLGSRAELVLEVAEADIEDLVVQDGSSMQVRVVGRGGDNPCVLWVTEELR
jgi:hypothetical protein